MSDMAEALKVVETHQSGDPIAIRSVRLLRGRVLVEIEPEPSTSLLWTPDPKTRTQRQHYGRVLAFGPPATTPGGTEVPHGYEPGDRVVFVWSVALEKVRRFAGNLAILAQEEIQAVISGDQVRE